MYKSENSWKCRSKKRARRAEKRDRYAARTMESHVSHAYQAYHKINFDPPCALKQRSRAFALVAVLVVLGVLRVLGWGVLGVVAARAVLMVRVVGEAVAAQSVRPLAVQAVVAAVRSYAVVAVVAAVVSIAEDPSSTGETGGRPRSRHR